LFLFLSQIAMTASV